MSVSSPRLASKGEYFQLFLMCSFPVHLWAFIALMKRASVIALPLNGTQILGVVAYVLFFALLESLFLFGLVFILSLILPPGFFRTRLVPAGTTLIFLASISAAFIHLYTIWDIQSIQSHLWTGIWIIFGLAAYVLAMNWVRRDRRVENVIRTAVERLSVLSLIYLFFDFLGTFVVIFRNLF